MDYFPYHNFIIYFKLQMDLYPVALALQQDNTQIRISHKITPLTKSKSAHNATQTRKGILQAINTI
jgi:hypothetical protein